MKKLLVAFVAVVAVSFASCGGNTEANVTDTIDSIVAEVEEVVDSALADTALVDSIFE